MPFDLQPGRGSELGHEEHEHSRQVSNLAYLSLSSRAMEFERSPRVITSSCIVINIIIHSSAPHYLQMQTLFSAESYSSMPDAQQ